MDATFKNSLALQMKKYNELDTFVAKMHYSGHTVALFQLYIDVIQNNYQTNTQKEILAQTLKDNITIISAEIRILLTSAISNRRGFVQTKNRAIVHYQSGRDHYR